MKKFTAALGPWGAFPALLHSLLYSKPYREQNARVEERILKAVKQGSRKAENRGSRVGWDRTPPMTIALAVRRMLLPRTWTWKTLCTQPYA